MHGHDCSLTRLTRWLAFEADSACGSMVLLDHGCAVFPRSARENRTPTKWSTAAPDRGRGAAKGKNADRVSPVSKVSFKQTNVCYETISPCSRHSGSKGT